MAVNTTRKICKLKKRTSKRNKHRRVVNTRKQRGGSTYFDHPWISSSPTSLLQRIGIAWSGEPAPVSLDPTVSGYKLLSEST